MKSSCFIFIIGLSCLGFNSLFAQLELGLVVHYPLNGNADDMSFNGFDGTPFDVAWGPNSFMEESGALIGNGSSTYIDMPNEPELKPDFPITVSVRANFFSISGQQVVFTNDFATTTHSGVWFQLSSAGAFAASFGNAQGGFISSTRHGKSANYTIEANTWYVITAIFRGQNDIDIYINCELVDGDYGGTASFVGYTNAPGSLCRKYANPISTGLPPFYLDGSIHDFRMWDRELEEEEILMLCATGCMGELSAISPTFCAGIPGLIHTDLSDIDEEVVEVDWSIDGLGDFQGDSLSLTIDSAGEYPYTLTVSTANGCSYEYEGEVTVFETNDPPELPQLIGYCEGSEATLDLGPYISAFGIGVEGGPDLDGPVYTFPGSGIYTFFFESECGSYSIDVEVEEGLASISLEMPDAVCFGTEVEVLIPEWPLISAEADLTIDFGNGTVVQVNSSMMSTSYTTSGSYTVSVYGLIGECEAFAAQDILVEDDSPEFSLEPVAELCQGEIFALDFSALGFDVINAQGDVVDGFETEVSGVYSFTALGACGNVEQFVTLTVIPFNPIPVGMNFQLCPGRDTLSLSFASQQYMFLWSNGSTQPAIEVSMPGTYVVQVSDSTGACSDDYSFSVQAFALSPQEVFPDGLISVCLEGDRTIHPAFIGVPYTFPDGSVGYSFEVQESGIFELLYSDLCYEYSHQVEVELKECLCPMWVPNVFTPNSDGRNDIFLPVVDCPVENYRLEILNRWGQLVFETSDLYQGWNGSFRGGDYFCSAGQYIYLIHYEQYLNELAIPKALTGHVTLIR